MGELRKELVPISKTYPLETLMEVVDEYAALSASAGKRNAAVMISYVLLAGVNDSLACARQLCELVKDRAVIVNLIPYNSFEENAHGYSTPSPEEVDAFLQVLSEAGVRVFERRHHGRDIAAACGQLAKLGGRDSAVVDIENCSGLASHNDVNAPPRSLDADIVVRSCEGPWRSATHCTALGLLLASACVATAALARWHGLRRQA